MRRKKKSPDLNNTTLTGLVEQQQAVDNVEDMTFGQLKSLVAEKKPKLRLRK
jgi:hypothetical protein